MEPSSVKKTTDLFQRQNLQLPFPIPETFVRRILSIPISLKLDWIWLRGLQGTSHGIDEKICLSDHWPLWTTVQLPAETQPETQTNLVIK